MLALREDFVISFSLPAWQTFAVQPAHLYRYRGRREAFISQHYV